MWAQAHDLDQGEAYAPAVSEPAATPIEPPPLSPEELAEIRAVLDQVRRGDYSGTIPWEEIAKEFDLPSARGS
jgi:hypothetical protein